MGIPEIIVVVLVICVLFVFFRLPFILRDKYPNKFWIGTLLCFLLGPLGQNYIPKSGWWVLALIFVFGAIKALTKDNNIAGYLTWILSVFLFVFRFRNMLKQNIKSEV
jgi:cyanate permease